MPRLRTALVALFVLIPAATASARGPLDGLLAPVLPALTPVSAPGLLDGLLPAQIGQLLDNADPAQLATLVGALSPEELQAALATLAPADLAALLAELQAAGDPALAPVIAIVTGLLPPGTTPATPGTGTGTPTTPGTTPGTTTGTDGSGATPLFTAYRARITKVKVARNRRSAKVTLKCPATAPFGCAVTLSGAKVSRLKLVLAKGTKRTTRVGLKRGVGRRLTVKAKTATSTLGTAKKSVRVKA